MCNYDSSPHKWAKYAHHPAMQLIPFGCTDTLLCHLSCHLSITVSSPQNCPPRSLSLRLPTQTPRPPPLPPGVRDHAWLPLGDPHGPHCPPASTQPRRAGGPHDGQRGGGGLRACVGPAGLGAPLPSAPLRSNLPPARRRWQGSCRGRDEGGEAGRPAGPADAAGAAGAAGAGRGVHGAQVSGGGERAQGPPAASLNPAVLLPAAPTSPATCPT